MRFLIQLNITIPHNITRYFANLCIARNAPQAYDTIRSGIHITKLWAAQRWPLILLNQRGFAHLQVCHLL